VSRGVATVPDERLEQFLTQCGLTWSVVPWEEHADLTNQWEGLYGNPHHWVHQKQGAKAQFEYAQQSSEAFRIVPFLGSVAGPHSIGTSGPRKAAYDCQGGGTLPDLSAFAGTEFFIVPADWSWTMIHTHEDYALGGPYFVRREWLGLPSRKKG
jgi:hypothetical protein